MTYLTLYFGLNNAYTYVSVYCWLKANWKTSLKAEMFSIIQNEIFLSKCMIYLIHTVHWNLNVFLHTSSWFFISFVFKVITCFIPAPRDSIFILVYKMYITRKQTRLLYEKCKFNFAFPCSGKILHCEAIT